jgi:hypothetical protein
MSNHEEHERREGHEAQSGQEGGRAGERTPSPWLRMRLPSPLSPEAELVMTETIGAAIAVHRELGPGRSAYQLQRFDASPGSPKNRRLRAADM